MVRYAIDNNIQKAEEAKKKAEELMQRKTLDEKEYAKVATILEMELTKIKVAKRYLKKKGLL